MAFDLNTVNPRLIEVWEQTRTRWPDKMQPDTRPLEEVEEDCEAQFPSDYWDFMKTYGSVSLSLGEIKACIIQYSIAGSIRKDWHWTLSISPSRSVRENYMTLSRPHMHYADLGPRIPPKTVPIGVSYSGDEAYLLDLSEEKYGRIWYKGEGTRATWGTEGNMILGFVAPSFTAFLAGLMTKDEAERKLAEEGR
ncbi:SMI1/KNR4 family protein [Mycobacterium sp. KBS0706]|uniref:SMI1/KNR4 family protein n=1 Tax=Mycobacterium sp. KBS0706 TaxID=2578109 RepID=UPI00110F9B6F|nr:SMI1/KNR4 family protein [Mycobacterium sp. KBS0706]TSD89835.1 SMI1/KNR4 family protein [Mycobacterium sp. KBS0706]